MIFMRYAGDIWCQGNRKLPQDQNRQSGMSSRVQTARWLPPKTKATICCSGALWKKGGGGEGEKLTVEEDKHLQMFEGKMILSSQWQKLTWRTWREATRSIKYLKRELKYELKNRKVKGLKSRGVYGQEKGRGKYGCGPTGRWDRFHIKQTENAAERSRGVANMMKFPLKATGGSDRAANNLGKGQHLPSSHSDSERFKSAESNQTTQLFL